ncbi:MAG: hypothetical protein DRK00_10855, partial [Thermoprotei archaeon]
FYELLAEAEVRVEEADFYRLISRAGEPPPVAAISEILGVDACLLGLRVGMREARPEDEEWLDVEVLPSFSRPDDVLYISIVYRSRDRDRVLRAVERVEKLAITIARSLHQLSSPR